MTKDDLKANAEWTNAELKDWADYQKANSPAARAILRLLAQEEARGEVVAACPHCSFHGPEWLPDAGCWSCWNCSTHIDTVAYWQRVQTPPDAKRGRAENIQEIAINRSAQTAPDQEG